MRGQINYTPFPIFSVLFVFHVCEDKLARVIVAIFNREDEFRSMAGKPNSTDVAG